MKRLVTHPSRIIASLAALFILMSSVALAPQSAQALTVTSTAGGCVVNVSSTSGVTVVEEGTSCYVAFKSTGFTYNWTRPGGVSSFDFLVVAGGGGGASRHAAGGGGGGYIQLTSQSITATTIDVSVGAGGAGGAAQSAGVGANGANGSNSTVSASGLTTQTAIGGGGTTWNGNGLAGGSGGGSSCCSGSGGAPTSGQGGWGGLGATGNYLGNPYWVGGGGGGAGANAMPATLPSAGNGGNGQGLNWINDVTGNSLGVGHRTNGFTYFSGGGGGGTAAFGTAGTGGIGGGGAGGAVGQAGTSGTPNSGGGGGGGGMNADNSSPAAGNGGSGFVVFRYAKATPVLNWNASDVNSFEETVSTTAINDIAAGSNYDGTLYNGSNAVAPGFDRTTGAWTFTSSASSAGPYAKVNTSISTNLFSTSGMTVDFQADFGSGSDLWERILDFGAVADGSSNVLVSRIGANDSIGIEFYNAAQTLGICQYANAGLTNGGMNRWTISVDGTTCKISKNGTEVYSVSYNAKPIANVTWTSNYIGRSNWSSDNTFGGSIRYLRIFQGALSASEMEAPVTKTVTLNAYDGNAQNGGGVTNNLQSPRLTTGSVRLPTPITRAGYTFTGWYTSTSFTTKVGDAGGIYTPSSTITLYGGWRTNIDSTALGNLVFNFDATHIDSLPAAATSSASIYPASSRISATGVGGITRDTANSPGAVALPSGTGSNYINFGAGNATNISGAISFESWFKCSAYRSGAAWNIIATHWFSDTGGTAATDWHFGIYNDRLQVNTSDGTSNIVSIGSKAWSSSDCGKWYLVGFTLDASGNLQIYINGRADGSLQTGKSHTANSSSIFMIGDGRPSSSRLQGYISRVRLYNAALTGTQMRNNFSGEAVTYGMGPYTVTYAAGPNGTGSNISETVNGSSQINGGTSITLKNNNAPFTRAGYYISGWTTSSASGAAQTNGLTSSYDVDASVTFYPVWTATSYTLTYNYNGATGGNSPASATYAAGGTAITLPTPTKTGYTFGGWWSTSTFNTGTQVTGTQTPSADATLYAKWNLVQYTLTFKANDGLATADITQTVSSGVAVNLRTNTFTKSRASFSRWSDVSTALSMNSWTDGQSITPTSDMTFYAIWNNEARVIFNSEGGSAVADAYTVGQPLNNAAALAKPTDPTKAGKIFGGWSTLESAGNGVASAIVTWPRDYEVNATETLYAIWLDACAPTKTTFTANGTSDLTSATYGNNGVKYIQYRFNTVGSCAWTIPSEVTALDVLLVGGGGGGSYYGRAGGGGAGALLHTTSSYAVNAGENYPVTVGAGGTFTYTTSDGNKGGNGGYSLFANFAAPGGGGAAGGGSSTGGTSQAAQSGGSGGGGACGSGNTSGGSAPLFNYSGWVSLANAGGSTNYATCAGGAGGGGAGGAGNANGTGGSSATRFGIALAGGGGAWMPSATTTGGGAGAGRWTNTGCPPSTSNDATANTGSGGGGCGSGASGTVIVRYVAPTYSVTYTYNGATGANGTASADYVDTALVLPTPTKTGYTFAGWYAESGLTTLVGNAGASYTPTSDTTLYAKWTNGSYTLTYNYNGATGGNGTASATYTTGGTAITLPTPTKTNYTFAGWYSDAGLTTQVTGAQTPSASATLYAKWTASTFTLTYNYNGATGGNGTATASYTTGGTVITLPNPTKTGYTFDGWYAESNFVTSITGTQTPTASATIYAKWTANTYTISYNVNGATGSQANASDSYTTGGAAVTLSAVGAMVKTGYNFSGWSATPTGSVIAGTYTTTADVTLYAIWTIKSISVTYSKGTASSATFLSFPANTSGNFGTRVTISNNVDSSVTYSSATYAFVGWSDGTSIYQSGEQYLLGDASVTLTAIWVQAFGVRYIVNGGTFANGTSTIDAECLVVGNLCTNGQTVTANAAPTRAGYTFNGWTDQSSNAISAGGTFTVNINSYLLYAGWTAIPYSITYAPNGGSTTPTQSALNYGDSFTLASAINRTGYTFNGWSDGTTIYGAGTTYSVGTNNVTLTAQWIAQTYTISYDWNGAAGSTTANVNYTVGNSGITLPTVGDHVKDGYTFGGWSSTLGGNALSSPYQPTTSGTLYAIWGSGSYTLTFNPNYGVQANSTTIVANGQSTVLPTLTRSNFVFDGWYSASTGGSKIGNGGTNFTPGGSNTLHARWIQASLFGVVGNLNRISTITASDSVTSSYNGTAGGSSVSVTLPSASLPAGTVVALDVITDTSYAQSLLTGSNSYILSIAVSWLAPDETVPNTNAGKSVSMTITNLSIKAGALVYSIQNGVVTLLGTATQNGTITVQLTSDPSVYVVATVPSAPQTLASTNTGTSATVTWATPTTDGGESITGYTVTLNTGASCATTLLTCTFNNLTVGTSYTATVIANNAVGASTPGSITFTPTAQQSSAPASPVTPTVPVTPKPPVVEPPVTPVPPTPTTPVLLPLPTAVVKVLANNVPVLRGNLVATPILFGADSTALDKSDLAQIKLAAKTLIAESGWVYVTGFVKSAGRSAAFEKKIATARAKAVAAQLSKLGLKVKIGFLGYGPHNTKSPSPKDRKVEIRFVPAAGQNT